jgi:transcription initiation factor TFIIIB Brf1 subunit/transcription initiation factor TFIIB
MDKAEPANAKAPGMQPGIEESSGSGNVIDALEKLADADLRAAINKAQTILAAREEERRRAADREKQEQQKEALREIQRLAKQFGLKVDVTAEKRKPGRPRKAKGPGQRRGAAG